MMLLCLFCKNYLKVSTFERNFVRNLWGKGFPNIGAKPEVKTKDLAMAKKVFKDIPDRDKETFLQIVDNAKDHYFIKRQGYIEFITAALPYLKEFGVHKDIEAYKALMNVFPKDGRYAPTNVFQEGYHYFLFQQRCAVRLLDEMEYNRVIPDAEMESLIRQIFGERSQVIRKLARSLYWSTKLKNKDPFPIPEDPLPLDTLELALLAMKRMCVDVQTKLSIYSTAQVKDSIDKTWIVSGQSPAQRKLIQELLPQEPIYVEGPFRIWLRDLSLSYFQLRGENKTESHVEDEDEINDVSRIPLNTFGGKDKTKILSSQQELHIENDGKYLALCITGTSSRDSLLSWIRLLELTNENLKNVQIIFTLKTMTSEIQTINESAEGNKNEGNKNEGNQDANNNS